MDQRVRVKLPSKSITMVKPTFKKVQVVYYISKNGQLEHPHIVEVTHLVHHQLKLKDVLERLSVLRGRGMPSLYSWSCKRMYKNGYVWNDLGENDVICPSEGDEYVLKASQLVFHSPDKHILGESHMAVPKPKRVTPKQHTEFSEEELDFEEKRINFTNNSSNHSKISTTLSPPSPPPSTTSGESNPTSKRFEDGDPYPPLSRNSLLFQLMACGGSIGFKGKPDHNNNNNQLQPHNAAGARKSSCSSSSSLHKGVLCKAAAAVEDEICCMSENPRFGNLQAEEREYFSGSIVETMTTEDRVQVEPILTKSSSYKEERRAKVTILMADEEEEEMKKEKSVAGKCIPNRFCLKPTKI
uniref:protein SOSEKI 2 n=1 Tax=Erigeron canadensis TaxID=72917 RepID=UPI001CB9085B|nr:protein SOSEKI 2 [Erigeron canadensis]